MRVEKDARSERMRKVILVRVPGHRNIEGNERLTDARSGFAFNSPSMSAVDVPPITESQAFPFRLPNSS